MAAQIVKFVLITEKKIKCVNRVLFHLHSSPCAACGPVLGNLARSRFLFAFNRASSFPRAFWAARNYQPAEQHPSQAKNEMVLVCWGFRKYWALAEKMGSGLVLTGRPCIQHIANNRDYALFVRPVVGVNSSLPNASFLLFNLNQKPHRTKLIWNWVESKTKRMTNDGHVTRP